MLHAPQQGEKRAFESVVRVHKECVCSLKMWPFYAGIIHFASIKCRSGWCLSSRWPVHQSAPSGWQWEKKKCWKPFYATTTSFRPVVISYFGPLQIYYFHEDSIGFMPMRSIPRSIHAQIQYRSSKAIPSRWITFYRPFTFADQDVRIVFCSAFVSPESILHYKLLFCSLTCLIV